MRVVKGETMQWVWPWKRNKRPKEAPKIPDGAVRVRLSYTGKVQAVGFRFTVDGCAGEAGVTGWVKNMFDGSVLCEAQGTPEQVEHFIALVQTQMDSPKTWIDGRLASREDIEPKADDRFSILNL